MILPAAQPGLEMPSKVDDTKMFVIDTPNVLGPALRLSLVALRDCKPEAKSQVWFQTFGADKRKVNTLGIARDVNDTLDILAYRCRTIRSSMKVSHVRLSVPRTCCGPRLLMVVCELVLLCRFGAPNPWKWLSFWQAVDSGFGLGLRSLATFLVLCTRCSSVNGPSSCLLAR